MYTEAKMNSAPLRPDGLPQCPSGLLFCEVTRRDELSDKGPYRSQASCYGNRVEGNYYLTLGLRHRLPEPFFSRNRVGSARRFASSVGQYRRGSTALRLMQMTRL
jgi:hypothetical protein